MSVKLDEELVCVCVSKSVYNHLQTEPQPLRYSPFGGPTTAQSTGTNASSAGDNISIILHSAAHHCCKQHFSLVEKRAVSAQPMFACSTLRKHYRILILEFSNSHPTKLSCIPSLENPWTLRARSASRCLSMAHQLSPRQFSDTFGASQPSKYLSRKAATSVPLFGHQHPFGMRQLQMLQPCTQWPSLLRGRSGCKKREPSRLRWILGDDVAWYKSVLFYLFVCSARRTCVGQFLKALYANPNQFSLISPRLQLSTHHSPSVPLYYRL